MITPSRIAATSTMPFVRLSLAVLMTTASAGAVTIQEIRISGNSYTARETIAGFCTFKAGQELTEEELTREIAASQMSLTRTNYFYRVTVSSLPREDVEKAVIHVRVDEGFLWRFGAGPTYVTVGKENMAGKARSLYVTAGWNWQEVAYGRRFLFGRPVSLGFDLGHRVEERREIEGLPGSGWESGTLRASAEMAYYFSPFVSAGIAGNFANVSFKTDRVDKAIAHEIGLLHRQGITEQKYYLHMDRLNDVFDPTRGTQIGVELRNVNATRNTSRHFDSDLDAVWYAPLGRDIYSRNRFYAGWRSPETPYYHLIDLRGINGIRCDSPRNAVGTTGLFLSTELQRRLATLTCGHLDPVIFADVGRTWEPGEGRRFAGFSYAVGAGLRLVFPAPMYVRVRLEAGTGSGTPGLFFAVEGYRTQSKRDWP
ncbi:MAG: BamA/TamA family outer membrane protein [Acidobacteria bacterium]|nr:BamA/TamA family outer membrane protein [Acidobacteriota bacterium]